MEKSKQIEILNRVLSKLERKESKCGLCHLIEIELALELDTSWVNIRNHIPLFTNDNAIKSANGRHNVYWWDGGNFKNGYTTYDYENRIKFIKWIISELEKQSDLDDIVTYYIKK